jgi:hypothetical protein
LTKGRGNAVVDGTRMEAQGRIERVSGRYIRDMLEVDVERRFEV